MIYLFDKSQKLIGSLNEKEKLTKAKLTRKINEAATLDLELPASSDNLSKIGNAKYAAVPYPDNTEKLLFLKIMTRTDEQDIVTLMGKEYAYQELATSGYIKDKRYQGADARTLMAGALSGSGYTLQNVNVSGSANTNFYYVDYLTAISNVIKLLGGEIKFYVTINGNQISSKYVDYVIAQGVNTSKVFAYGSNLISIEKQSDASSVYTAILPRGKGEQVSVGENGPDGYGRRITIEDVAWAKPTNPLNKPAGSLILEDPAATAAFGQANGTARLLLKTYDEIESPQELIQAAYKDLQSYNHPAVQFKASVANIGDSGLGDTIVIMHSERSMSYRTRIFQIEYDLIELGNTVATFGDNLSKNNTSSMLTNVSRAVDNVKEVANNALVSANGINNNYYGEKEPVNPKNGDTWFYAEGEAFGIRQYINGQWVDYVDTNTSKKINSQVDAAIKNAQSYADSLNNKQSEATQSLASDLATKADELKKSQQNIASQANAYTDSAVADANAKAVEIGQTTAKNAQSALSAAKNSLSSEIASQATAYTSSATVIEERAQNALSAAKSSLSSAITSQATATSSLVSAVDSNASKYATQAKSEAVSTAQTADGVVRSDFKKTTDSMTATITQNKSEADGKIKTAQTTATQALNGLATKVSQTEYNTKTGQLQTDLTETIQTANQAKTDIVSIKQKDSEQDEKMNSIVSDVNGTKQTISDLQTVQGKQSGDISTLQQRADGFEATVTKVNNLSVGGRNLVLGTSNQVVQAKDWNLKVANIKYDKSLGRTVTASVMINNADHAEVLRQGFARVYLDTLDSSGNTLKSVSGNPISYNANGISWCSISIDDNTASVQARIWTNNMMGNAYYSRLKVERGNVPTDWTPAPEDLESATAKAQLTADQATVSINNYKTDADGRISKAQADIIANANAITQKVSQSEYNAKSGELTTSASKAQQTADSATQTIGTYKESNDKRVTAAETNIKANADAILQTVSKTDFDKATGKLSGDVSTLQQRADGFDATVTKVNNLAVGVRNYALNTANPLTINGTGASNQATSDNTTYPAGRYHINPDVLDKQTIVSFDLTLDNDMQSGSTLFLQVFNYAGNWNIFAQQTGLKSGTTHVSVSWKAPVKNGTGDLVLRGVSNSYTGKITISNFSVVLGNQAPISWLPAPEDLESATAKAQLTADQATVSINNYKTDADGRISKAQADIKVNADAITQKVSQSDYNTKTGELTQSASKAQQTADTATQTIGTYKQTNDKRVEAAETNIKANSDAILQTVSNTDFNQVTGKLSGDISTLQQRANGFDATVTKVNNLAVGGRNLLLNSKLLTWVVCNNSNATSTKVSYDSTTNMWHITAPKGSGVNTGIYFSQVNNVSNVITQGQQWAFSFDIKGTGVYSDKHIGVEGSNPFNSPIGNVPSDWTRVSSTGTATGKNVIIIYFNSINVALDVYIKLPKLEIGNIATDWSPAPEDVDSNIAQVKLTADGLYEKVNNPTTGIATRLLTAEGAVTTVQNATKELTSKQTLTAGGLTQEISDRKTGDTNTLQAGKDFTTSQIKNYDSGVQSQISQVSDGILAKVGATNLFPNSEFDADYGYRKKDGKTVLSLATKNNVDGAYNGTVSVTSTGASFQGYWTNNIPVQGGQKYSASVKVHYTNGGLTNGNAGLDLWFIDNSGNRISNASAYTWQVSSPYWVQLTSEGVTAPANAIYLQMSLVVNNAGAGQVAVFTQPMLTATEKLQKYTPNSDVSSQLSLLKDNWKIGIANNIGLITSGIVGDNNSINLISKNVTIDSPNTQIKGTAWITNAMLGNASVSTVQIADAAITSAKIIDLDVNKLSGNITNFIKTNWDGQYQSTHIDSNGMTINAGSTSTAFDSSGAHITQGNLNADYSFGTWRDASNANTSSLGLYLGIRGNSNSFTNIIGPNGGSAVLLAGDNMDYGSNNNIVKGYMNVFSNVNIRSRLDFKGSRWNSPTYIEADENRRTLNFYTALGNTGNDGNYFWFSQNVLSNGVFSSASLLSKKNVKSAYEEDALGEIAKTQLVNFEYKNRVGQTHVSPIIDDVNSEKEYYIPETILGQNGEYVDMYSMISMAWKAIQQLNEKIGEK